MSWGERFALIWTRRSTTTMSPFPGVDECLSTRSHCFASDLRIFSGSGLDLVPTRAGLGKIWNWLENSIRHTTGPLDTYRHGAGGPCAPAEARYPQPGGC